jgi:hypothetical protein
MSTGQQTIFQNRPDVIVRAFRGEPVRLRAIAGRGEVIEVFRNSEDTTIGLPTTAVYSFDEQRFAELRDAFVRGDNRNLERLWKECPPFQDEGH